MKSITDTTMAAEVLGSKKPAIIKFEANWCQPCKAMTPIITAIEAELGSRIRFYSANVEHCQLVAQKYRISQIPALVAFENGVVTSVKTGAVQKQQILQWIDLSFPGLRTL